VIYALISTKICRESRAFALEPYDYHSPLGGFVNFKLNTFYFGLKQFETFKRIDLPALCYKMEKVLWGYTTRPFMPSLHFEMLFNSGFRELTNVKDLKLELWPSCKPYELP
jgi:hypothetical protein